mmetsp:Transcript_65254/g.142104  ORF Transcript_65254/g.142104 Transcript_65254/m.142104 type:complete len:225 (-) Transcript_65254:143-817(-)|eukprot:CAMPEP_0170602850 /NCGR_PEP_ID=MMETSP0224-20130122/18608_1 /TAXON_ID=285029 /ORGANISM="Togula jolla, Strain CCCM 725" /LENGTH=224 /DNA_ID=CAMNT_0010927711 /DNA_START=202 /DNA_END=876 /DNA_ORIENTATION=-
MLADGRCISVLWPAHRHRKTRENFPDALIEGLVADAGLQNRQDVVSIGPVETGRFPDVNLVTEALMPFRRSVFERDERNVCIGAGALEHENLHEAPKPGGVSMPGEHEQFRAASHEERNAGNSLLQVIGMEARLVQPEKGFPIVFLSEGLAPILQGGPLLGGIIVPGVREEDVHLAQYCWDCPSTQRCRKGARGFPVTATGHFPRLQVCLAELIQRQRTEMFLS